MSKDEMKKECPFFWDITWRTGTGRETGAHHECRLVAGHTGPHTCLCGAEEVQRCDYCGASLHPDGVCSEGCDDVLDDDLESYFYYPPEPESDLGRDEDDHA